VGSGEKGREKKKLLTTFNKMEKSKTREASAVCPCHVSKRSRKREKHQKSWGQRKKNSFGGAALGRGSTRKNGEGGNRKEGVGKKKKGKKKKESFSGNKIGEKKSLCAAKREKADEGRKRKPLKRSKRRKTKGLTERGKKK